MDERNSERIQRDIERTRADMSETIEALERRLSPGELVDELWGRVRGGETGAHVGETIRDHPVPLALMGLGLGWLAIEKASESRTAQLRARHGDPGEGTYARAEGRVGPYRGDDVIDPRHSYGESGGIGEKAGEMKDRITEMGSGLKDRISDAGDHLRHRGDEGGGGEGEGPRLRDRAHEMRMDAEGQLRHARAQARQRGTQLEEGFRSVLDDYPLALGAISFGIGVAMGAGAPATRKEDELLGDAADTFKDEVRSTTRETTERARHVVDETAHAARSEAEREGIGDDLRDKAERVAQVVRSTAGEEAQSQGLTGEALKERTREIGKRTTDQA